MAYDAGTAWLLIAPSFRGFGAAVRREAAEAGRQAGLIFREEFDRVSRAGTGGPIGPDRSTQARAGAGAAGAFADAFRARLAAAARSFPDIQIGAATSKAEQDLRDLQARIQALRDAEIGVDINADDAKAELRLLQAQLELLAASSPDIRVRVDSAKASAELKLLLAEVNRLDGQNPTITPIVNAGPAAAGLGLIGIAALSILPILIPITAAASAALAGIATGAFVAVAGIGVLVLALSGVIKAVMAGSAADKDAGKASAGLASTRQAQAAAADQLVSAERSLVNTRANAARQEQRAARAIEDAQRGVADARRAAAESARAAAQAVRDAEASLADAQARALDAQKALTQARLDARAALEDLDSRVKNNALNQREAALELEKAEKQLAFVRLFGARANARQVEQAQLAYDEAAQRVADLTREGQRLTTQQTDAAKAGVEGSAQVVQAKQNVVAAEDAVKTAEAATNTARRQQTRDAQDSARRIADAQRAVADAQVRAADQQRQSAFAIANAQQAVVNAHRAVAAAAVSSSATGTSAADKYREAMDKLSPAGQRFVRFLREKLLPGFGELRKAAETGLLPGLQAGIEAAAPLFEPLKRVVGATARAFGTLARDAGRALASPFWTQFTDFIATMIGPNTRIFGRILGGLAQGLAGLFQGFEPTSRSFGQALGDIMQKFARFGESVGTGKNKGFAKFIAYIREVGPKVIDFFKSFGDAFGRIIQGLAPFGSDLMALFTALFDGIKKLPPTLIGAIAAGFLAMSVAVAAIGAAAALNPAGVIIGIGVALIYAYRHSEKFRAIVGPALHAIGDAATWLWQNAIKPAFEGISKAFDLWWNYYAHPILTAFKVLLTDVIFPTVRFLWQHVVKPVFEAIGTAIAFWWNNIVRPVFAAVKAYFENVLFPVYRFLWQNVVKPVFKGIGDVISGAWNKVIKPVFGALKSTAEGLGGIFGKAVDGIRAAWGAIKEAAAAPVRFVLDTVINKGIIAGINWIITKFGLDPIHEIGVPGELAAPGADVAARHTESGYATGGVIPGYTPGRDDRLIAVGGGEAIMRPEWTRAVGAEHVHAMNALARSGGVDAVRRALGLPGFALGGIFEQIKDKVTGGAHFGVEAAKFLAHPLKYLKAKILGPLKQLDVLGSSPFTDAVKGAPAWAGHQLVNLGRHFVGIFKGAVSGDADGGSAAAYTGPGGVEQWRPVALQALAEANAPATWIGSLLRRMNQESGGNPRAVNLTDINAQRGTPSVGLMQVIGPTFAGKYRGTGPFLYGTSVDPLANIFAAIRYTIGRYGSGPAGWDRAGGYDAGGYLPPGVTTAINRTRRPEAVLTAGQWADIHTAATGGAGAGGREALLKVEGGFHTYENQSPAQIANELAWLMRARG